MRLIQLFDSLFNGRIMFSDEEWVAMFDSKLHELSSEGQIVHCLTRLPNLMRRAKIALSGDFDDLAKIPVLRKEAHSIREDLEPPVSKLRQRWYENKEKSVAAAQKTNSVLDALWHCHILRTYAFGLAVAIFVNEGRLALYLDAPEIVQESHGFALEILEMANMAYQYRPLGGYALSVCLLAAEIGAADVVTKESIRLVRIDYARDFRGAEEVKERRDLNLICGRGWSQMLARETG